MVIYSNHRGRGPKEAKGQLQDTTKVSRVEDHDIRNIGERVNGDACSIGRVISLAEDLRHSV
jgi:hypothetical protein